MLMFHERGMWVMVVYAQECERWCAQIRSVCTSAILPHPFLNE